MKFAKAKKNGNKKTNTNQSVKKETQYFDTTEGSGGTVTDDFRGCLAPHPDLLIAAAYGRQGVHRLGVESLAEQAGAGGLVTAEGTN